jgi:hypothetical protein
MLRSALSVLAAVVLALALAGTVAAKGDTVAELDAPIPRDAQPGTEIDVGWRAWVPDGDNEWPFEGLPVFIRLTSPDGASSTEAFAAEDPPGSGHFLATVVVPDGGVGLVEVGLFGESCIDSECTRSDLLFPLPEDQTVPGTAEISVAGPPGAAVAALAVGLRAQVGVTHGPARVAAPAHAGLRRGFQGA